MCRFRSSHSAASTWVLNLGEFGPLGGRVGGGVEAALKDSEVPADAVDAASPEAIGGDELLAELQRRSASYRNRTMTARPAAEVIADLLAAQEDRHGR